MQFGERQVAPGLDGIRRDHLERYLWAAQQIRPNSVVLDVCCGVGYGSFILAEAGHRVIAFDRDAEAIAYAKEHYAHKNISYGCEDANWINVKRPIDVAVCFEAIEHLEHPMGLLRALRCAKVLLASVPNEDKFPYRNYKFHYRHYTKDEFHSLLHGAGFSVSGWFGQQGTESAVGAGVNGRTLVASAICVSDPTKIGPLKSTKKLDKKKGPVPDRVAILGLGPSLEVFVDLCKRAGSTKKICDEVWGINSLGDVLRCDRVFHMDDVRIQEIRAAADPNGNIAAMLPWLRKHTGPVYTSRRHPDYPGLVDYPLADVLNSCKGQRYFNSTAAYAVAYAIHLGVKKIICAGMDFSYAHSHDAEKGRACVEFWLGIAIERGIDIAIVKNSTLLDACVPPSQRLYGYDTVEVTISGRSGAERVKMKPRQSLPSAEEIEDRYDHSQPTTPQHLRES